MLRAVSRRSKRLFSFQTFNGLELAKGVILSVGHGAATPFRITAREDGYVTRCVYLVKAPCPENPHVAITKRFFEGGEDVALYTANPFDVKTAVELFPRRKTVSSGQTYRVVVSDAHGGDSTGVLVPGTPLATVTGVGYAGLSGAPVFLEGTGSFIGMYCARKPATRGSFSRIRKIEAAVSAGRDMIVKLGLREALLDPRDEPTMDGEALYPLT